MSHGPAWYWHRLRAMRVAEIRQRIAQKWRKRADAKRPPDFARDEASVAPSDWPALPSRDTAPEAVTAPLRQDATTILAGKWRAFGHLQIQVDDPPRWFTDYAARRDHPTARPGVRLNHRELPAGSDIKLVWELSRWQQLVRLAQAAYVLNDRDAAQKCLDWLDDWRRKNPPFVGWNWTSALESGIRLINFAWIDALLAAAGVDAASLERLRTAVVPAHLWYTWRHRSFGSSANNHLLGELAGLVVAVVRWPGLAAWAAPRAELRALLETEILAQFAPDGGNREQALNYQLFAWELAWHADAALAAAGQPLGPEARERLHRAGDFFVTVQNPAEPWDYGDSDSATVVPVFGDEARATAEWYAWFSQEPAGAAIRWWLGEPPPPVQPPTCVRAGADWLVFPDTGQATCWSGPWSARFDLSPLGYLATAAHGHLDALHFSLWLDGVALVVDPGTGAYYGDVRLRAWLASWDAHNGPHPGGIPFPKRLGPFLWGPHHGAPSWQWLEPNTIVGELALPRGIASRHVRRVVDPETDNDGWEIDDLYQPAAPDAEPGFRVCWQFAPGTRLEAVTGSPRFFRGERMGRRFTVGFDSAWNTLRFLPETSESVGFPVAGDLTGLCSPAFRRIQAGPRVELSTHGANPSRYRTTFLIDRETP
ncbi:MAG: heparinase II/III family protein [Verrucomicrobiales bacterium]|nr:heparinase II/III family protein [Verrucomicrobiales bacterium]